MPSELRLIFQVRKSSQGILLSAFTPWGGTNVGTDRKFPKKVSVPAYPAFACALKTRCSPALKPIWGILRGA
jgi:hypothetical protein